MAHPKLAICNFIHDDDRLKQMALACGFSGVDWTFEPQDLPMTEIDESRLLKRIEKFYPLEVRYHCAFKGLDFGDSDPRKAGFAVDAFRRACKAVSMLDGRFMTIHLGLGRESYEELSWKRSVAGLADLVEFAGDLGVRVCLENLASGWSSRPELFEKLVRKSNAGVTLDIGHARMSPSVRNQRFAFEDFIAPHYDRICNAHIYHEERDDRHTAPTGPADMLDRLRILSCLPCDWWVLELREESALIETLRVVREFLDAIPAGQPPEYLAMIQG